jgi:hypothetical protein
MQCQECRRELRDDEPIYRLSMGYGSNNYAKYGGCIASMCAGCREKRCGPAPVSIIYALHNGKPCANCGRPVFIECRLKLPKYVVCGAACRQAVYQSVARQRRRLPLRECAICGKQFQPKRTDARYCGMACKQVAFRRGRPPLASPGGHP